MLNLYKLQKLNDWHTNWMYVIIFLSMIFTRLCVYFITEYFNVINDSGVPIKFGGEPAFLDYINYKNHVLTAWTEITRPVNFFIRLLEDWKSACVWLKEQELKPGPIFPMLIKISGYEENRYFLAWIYQIGGCLLGLHWAKWLRSVGEALWLQIVSACFPALIYYSLLVSTDLLYACLIALWLFSARKVLENTKGYWSLTIVLTLLLLLARPNSIALLPMMSLLAWKVKNFRVCLLWNLFWGMVGVYMLIYYLPYYWIHDSNAGSTHYWGILPYDYYNGIFRTIPAWISTPLSWLIFAISKLMYSVGLRPSYASVNELYVIVRAIPGLLFLPGLIYLLFSSHWFERCFVFFFILPVFIGASQERYLLALTPFLLLWGVRAWRRAGNWICSQLGFAKN